MSDILKHFRIAVTLQSISPDFFKQKPYITEQINIFDSYNIFNFSLLTFF